MKKFTGKLLSAIIVISLVILIVMSVLGILAEISPPLFERLLSLLKIPLNYDGFLAVAYIDLAVMLLSIFIRNKFFDD